MLNRLRQVIHALTAQMTTADYQYIQSYLTPAELTAFQDMDLNSQKHAVKVAQTAVALAAEAHGVNLSILIRAGLLHDLGKLRGDLTTFRRIMIVIINRLMPKLGHYLAERGQQSKQQNLARAFYIYHAHPKIGLEKAKVAGVEPAILELIARHHEAYHPAEATELTCLRKADNLN